MHTAPSRLITLDDAADRLAISPARVQRLINRGHFPATRIGGDVRIAESVIDKYIQDVSRKGVFGNYPDPLQD